MIFISILQDIADMVATVREEPNYGRLMQKQKGKKRKKTAFHLF